MKFVIVITARGGSKRLPGKNLLEFAETSLLGFTINFAKNGFPDLPLFVSSDDDMILNEAKSNGSEVIKRPEYLATDISTSADVLKHCLQHFKSIGVDLDAIILLQPTNPFRFNADLAAGIQQFRQSGRSSLATVSLCRKKLCRISNVGIINWLSEPGTRSQDLKEFYFENGNFYITKKEIIERGKVISEDCLPFVQESDLCAVDIDTLEDYVTSLALIPHFVSMNFKVSN